MHAMLKAGTMEAMGKPEKLKAKGKEKPHAKRLLVLTPRACGIMRRET